MHMSSTLGGWCFYDKTFDELNGKLLEPRFVSQGDVTVTTLATASSKILEINSKSGLYPLYVAYSIYRQRCLNYNSRKLDETLEKQIWRDTLKDNVVDVRLTNKLSNHPVCLTTEGEISVEMQKVLNALPNDQKVNAKMIMEINESHPIANKLKTLYTEDKEGILYESLSEP